MPTPRDTSRPGSPGGPSSRHPTTPGASTPAAPQLRPRWQPLTPGGFRELIRRWLQRPALRSPWDCLSPGSQGGTDHSASAHLRAGPVTGPPPAPGWLRLRPPSPLHQSTRLAPLVPSHSQPPAWGSSPPHLAPLGCSAAPMGGQPGGRLPPPHREERDLGGASLKAPHTGPAGGGRGEAGGASAAPGQAWLLLCTYPSDAPPPTPGGSMESSTYSPNTRDLALLQTPKPSPLGNERIETLSNLPKVTQGAEM